MGWMDGFTQFCSVLFYFSSCFCCCRSVDLILQNIGLIGLRLCCLYSSSSSVCILRCASAVLFCFFLFCSSSLPNLGLGFPLLTPQSLGGSQRHSCCFCWFYCHAELFSLCHYQPSSQRGVVVGLIAIVVSRLLLLLLLQGAAVRWYCNFAKTLLTRKTIDTISPSTATIITTTTIEHTHVDLLLL